MASNRLDHISKTYDSHLAQNYKPMEGFTLAGSYGQYVIDTEGTYKLDGLSCYGAVNFGHKHPKIVAALEACLETPEFFKNDVESGRAKPGVRVEGANNFGGLSAVSRNYRTRPAESFADKLCALTGLDKMLPSSGGVEAVETAFKAARRWGADVKGIPDGEQKILLARGCFHGRTISVVSGSDEVSAKAGYGPLTPGFLKVPYGDAEALAHMIMEHADELCAVVLEPVQGEGGVIIPPAGYLKKAQALCRQYNVMFILDEIQSGMGRSGKNFAFEYELESPPDGLILAKALSGGLIPLSAFVAKAELLDAITPGTHGSTYGGNPMASSIGMAALDVLVDEKMAEKSAALGEQLLDGLRALKSDHIHDVRGKGLWIGIELKDKKTAKEFARVMCVGKHILCKDARKTVRISPPFVTKPDEIDLIVKAVSEICGDF